MTDDLRVREQHHSNTEAAAPATRPTRPALSPIRGLGVVVVDDHAALREGVSMLVSDDGHDVLATAGDFATGLDAVLTCRPDVALIDVALDAESGIELARRLATEAPLTRIVLYTGLADRTTLTMMLDAPAQGFLLKAGSPDEMLEALRVVGDGGSFVDQRLHRMLLSERRSERRGVISPREREILSLLAAGSTGEQIAEQLFLSRETVKTHVRNATAKLRAHTRTQAVAVALSMGEIDPVSDDR